MKSPLLRLRGIGHHHHHRKAHHPPPAKLDELAYAAQDVEEMTNCYDGLLSAAAATTNSVYEFSEAMEEMGACLLAKTALNDDDDDSGRVLIKLGKAQFELHKHLDNYRTDIINTITTPSESLLKELQTVEEMKHQCDMKREAYEAMRASYREKGQSRHSKIESFSTEQLQASFLEYQEDAALFIFRLKSLKQGQFHSISTQAARHYAAQLNFFRRGVKCLEPLEPHVKAMAEKQHIDFQFTSFEDDESDDDGHSSYQDTCSDDGELSFDYKINDRDQDLIVSKDSMDLDKRALTSSPKAVNESEQEDAKQPKAELVAPPMQSEFAGHSAPIFSDNLPDQGERLRQMRPSSTRLSYKLPTPVDDNHHKAADAHRPHHSAQFFESKPRAATMNLWHSSPLMKDYKPSSSTTMHSGPLKMPSSTEARSAYSSHSVSDSKKLKRESWSGPITSKAGSSKLFSQADHRPSSSSSSMGYPHANAMPTRSTHGHARQSSSVSPKVSPRILPLPAASPPKISELHELPRPPPNVLDPPRPSGLVGYSGPLVSKRHHQAPAAAAAARASPTASPQTASPLPLPPATLTRSYSIPSNSQRTPIITVNKLLEARHSGDVSSPPLTPLSLADLSHHPSQRAATAIAAGREEIL